MWLQEENALDVNAANLVLHAQYLASATKKNVAPKLTHKLSWTLDKIGKYIFSERNLSVYGQKITNSKEVFS